jgi:hypothetical protein
LGTVGGLVSFIAIGSRTFELVAYSDVARFPGREAAFRTTFSSLGPVTDTALLDVDIKRILVTSVHADMTLNELQRQSPSVVPVNDLALLNGAAPGQSLVPGQMVKRVIAVPASSSSGGRASVPTR